MINFFRHLFMFDLKGTVVCVKVPPNGKFTLNKRYECDDIDLVAHGPGVSVFAFTVVDDTGNKVVSYNSYFELID